MNNFATRLDALLASTTTEEEHVALVAEIVEEGLQDQTEASLREDRPQIEEPCPDTSPSPSFEEESEVVQETPEQKTRRLELAKPIVGVISTEKLVHGSMVLQGVCERCVCCGLPLTDAVSLERGMGGRCSSRGYSEDPKQSDEMGAMIELAEYPALVEFLTQKYKPLGVRGLMNGLVRIACLNRKTRVHVVCANAIEMLGYVRLANKLRDALVIGHVLNSKSHPEHLSVWVKRYHYNYKFSRVIGQIPGAFFDRAERGWMISKHPETKKALWKAFVEYYPHEVIKTSKGSVKIPSMDDIKKRGTT